MGGSSRNMEARRPSSVAELVARSKIPKSSLKLPFNILCESVQKLLDKVRATLSTLPVSMWFHVFLFALGGFMHERRRHPGSLCPLFTSHQVNMHCYIELWIYKWYFSFVVEILPDHKEFKKEQSSPLYTGLRSVYFAEFFLLLFTFFDNRI